MLLRPRQQLFKGRVLEAFGAHSRVLGVAPTGAGKTVMLSAIAGEFERVLVLQHRDELVAQNQATFQKVNPGFPTSRWTSTKKRWARRGATFAMVPTLHRTLARQQPVDLVVIDEAHHIMAKTWRACLERARELNPDVKVLGVTATPTRGDRQGLGEVFEHVADQITLGELIQAGHLVPPRARVIDVGLSNELRAVKKTRMGEYDMRDVERIMLPATQAVIDQWRTYAGDRQTVVFTSTTAHAEHVAAAYRAAGVETVVVTGKTPKGDRARYFRQLDTGHAQVLVNVAVATEGFDCQPVSCVVLLRPSSFQSTLIQMIGRGLRVVDPRRYPDAPPKVDCEVLDFGRSLLTHGGIEQVLDLEGKGKGDGSESETAAPTKLCPACRKRIPIACKQCPLCAHVFPVVEIDDEAPLEIRMVELDLLIGQSPFRWWHANERTMVATAFKTWAVAFELGGTWHAFGGSEDERCAELANGTRVAAVAAGDDWMRLHGDRKAAAKNAEWLTRPPSDAQLRLLERMGIQARGLNRYEAACRLTLKFNKRLIAKAMEERKAA